MTGYPELDVLRPYNGPCWFCGGPDQRHRLADALVEAVGGGDSPAFLVEIYDYPEITVPVIERLVAVREANRKRRKYRWATLPRSME
jgi:hypothetical protein